MKISQASKRDFNFYTCFPKWVKFDFSFKYGENGVTALEAFSTYESTGQIKPCREIELLNRALSGKSNFNLAIKMWNEGLAEGSFLVEEFNDQLRVFNAPDWCFNRLKQA